MLVTAVALRALLLSGGAYSSRLVVPVQPAGTCAWSQPSSTSSRVVTRHAPPECSLLNRGNDEVVPPLDEHPRRKVALLVEPTPFTHISGYSNRFKEMLRHLKARPPASPPSPRRERARRRAVTPWRRLYSPRARPTHPLAAPITGRRRPVCGDHSR